MKYIAIFSLIASMFLLTGCPLQTKNSIDDGSADVPSWLPGKWSEIDKNGKIKSTYLLEKDQKKGLLKCYDVDSPNVVNRTKIKPIIMSSVGGKIFLNVYQPADETTEEGYYLFEFRKVSNKEFILAGIKEHSVIFDAKRVDIVAFLEEIKDDKEAYDAEDMLRYKKQ